MVFRLCSYVDEKMAARLDVIIRWGLKLVVLELLKFLLCKSVFGDVKVSKWAYLSVRKAIQFYMKNVYFEFYIEIIDTNL